MAYRRKPGNPRSSSTYEEFRSPPAATAAGEPSSLAAQAIRASSAHRDSSLSSAYGEPAFNPTRREPADRQTRSSSQKDSNPYEYTSMKSLNENKYGFWGILARKAKNIVEVENARQRHEIPNRDRFENLNRDQPSTDETIGNQPYQPHHAFEDFGKKESPKLQKGLGAITSSLNYIGGKVGNALEEGLQIVESRTADIIQETRKLNMRRKGSGFNVENRAADSLGQQNIPHFQRDIETQLKAARDVANAMAAKAKLLMRELKTVKADLAFAKERCAQLEEENRVLRESNEKGDHPEDDDLIRLQLETLLAEKARLAHENSVYTRENRFLREIVEYHQLTMQDVVYLDEGIEEVTEVYPTQSPTLSSHGAPASPPPSPTVSQIPTFSEPASHSIVPVPPPAILSSSSSNTPSPTTTSPHTSFGRAVSTVFPVIPTQTASDHFVTLSTGEPASAKVV